MELLRSKCSMSEPAPKPSDVPCSVSSANVFDVVAKFCTVATIFLKFCSIGSDGLALALAARVLGVDCAASEGRIYTGSREDAAESGLFLG